jgi:hypothetical protein
MVREGDGWTCSETSCPQFGYVYRDDARGYRFCVHGRVPLGQTCPACNPLRRP